MLTFGNFIQSLYLPQITILKTQEGTQVPILTYLRRLERPR